MQKISHTYLSGEKLSVFFDTGGLALAIRTTTSGVALTKRASGALGPAHFGAVGLVSEKQAGVFRSEEGSLWGGKGRPQLFRRSPFFWMRVSMRDKKEAHKAATSWFWLMCFSASRRFSRKAW